MKMFLFLFFIIPEDGMVSVLHHQYMLFHIRDLMTFLVNLNLSITEKLLFHLCFSVHVCCLAATMNYEQTVPEFHMLL